MRRLVPALVVVSALLAAASLRPPSGPDAVPAAFGRLPVLHNGRIKPLDTVARTSLLMLRGKQTVPSGERRLSASEWLLELAARPGEADRLKVFAIDDPDVLGLMGMEQRKDKHYSFEELGPHLGAVREQSAAAERVPAARRSRFEAAVAHLGRRVVLYQKLKNTLSIAGSEDLSEEYELYRAGLGRGLRAVMAHQSSRRFDRRHLAEISAFFARYRFLEGAGAFLPLPPEPGEPPEAWAAMGRGLLEALHTGELRPGVHEYAAILDARRAAGADAAFPAAVAAWEERLRELAPAALRRARAETVFNRAEPFYLGMILYLAAFLLAAASWLRPALGWRPAYAQLLCAFAVHTAGLLARMILQGRPPVTNLYSSAVFVGWAAVALGAVLERVHKRGIAAAAAAAAGFLTLIVAHHLALGGDTMEMMQAVLDSNFWLGTHVVVITIGYSSTFLAGALGIVYILRGTLTRSLSASSAKALAQMTYGVVCFSLLMSFVGTILGGIWADQSWGRFWGWDPKENGALLIVLWNAMILHARWGGFIRERGLMMMAVFGNVLTSLSWFGVNMLGIGLHSYGFMDKAFWWLAAFIASQLAVMALGSLPRGRWKSA